MEKKEFDKRKRLRRVSTWMSDTLKEEDSFDELYAGKIIVLKILRYMEENGLTQRQLAEKLGVSPQYINKFLHGQEWDLKLSTLIRYGKILNLDLIKIPDQYESSAPKPQVIYSVVKCNIVTTVPEEFNYSRENDRIYKFH